MYNRRRRAPLMAAVTACLILSAALVGCSPSAPTAQKTHSAAAAAPDTPAPVPSPTPSHAEAPNYLKFSLGCYSLDYKTTTTFRSFDEAWAGTGPGKFASCKAEAFAGKQLSPADSAAIAAAGYEPSKVGLLYEVCMNLGDYYYTSPTVSAAQAGDIAGMAALCPNNPQMPALLSKAAAAGAVVKDLADGTRIGPGLFQVGAQIKPGTFVHDGAVANCYWERLDPNGTVIDNSFIPAANRVQVTIAASDYSFHSTGCGDWVRTG